MTESGQNSIGKSARDVDELLAGIQDLDEEHRKDLMAKLMAVVLHGPAKKIAIAEAVKSAADDVQQDLVTQAVSSADDLQAKKAAAAQAVERAQSGEESEVVAEAVKSASTLEGKKTAATEAFKNTPDLHDKQEILASIRNQTEDVREMVGHTILWSFVVVAVVASLTLIVSLFGLISSVQTLIVIATALASTLAGYSLGAASLIGQRLRDFARRETEQREEQEVA